ncbi:FAD-dependent monooxygenase [Sinosporangium siamense]|uniref:Monooxygenase n=1 Tax=Sinosporangium siamense TaxID=1367973 RepID=A0A919VBL9_9ACTN|nr:FAD-dependent monooxygenase [Sinosporangium siamense]GII96647.1 monooxygenase [Sinosporangium siamense]
MGKRVIVVGGGIGGMACAVGMERAGWEVTVLERAPAFTELGAGLVLAPNAVRAVDRLGLGAALRAKGMPYGSAGIRSRTGAWLVKGDLTDIERRYGVPFFALHRADVHRMFLDALSHTDLRTDHRVISVSRGDDGAEVVFEGPGGQGTAEADMVVVADGAHSRLRGLLFPEHPGLEYAGYVAWRGVVPAEEGRRIRTEGGPAETWGWNSKRFGVIPLPDGRIYWYASAPYPEGACAGDGMADLIRRFGRMHDPVPAVLASTPEENLLRHDVYHLREPLPGYAVGRIVLIGDAAHAITPDLGQGGCLALEDAVTLAVLSERHSAVPALLRAYGELRVARTQRLVGMSYRTSRVAQWREPLAIGLRDTVMRMIPMSGIMRSMDDVLDWAPPDSP